MIATHLIRSAAAAALLLSPLALPSGAASIVGDQIEIWNTPQLNGVPTFEAAAEVVDPGVEYTATISSDIYHVDLAASSILLTTEAAWFSPWFDSGNAPSSMEIRDINVPGQPGLAISGIDVFYSDNIVTDDSAPLGHPAFSAANVSFTPDSVRLEYGGYRFPEGSEVLVNLHFAPEPASLAVGAVAIACLAGRRRRRGAVL